MKFVPFVFVRGRPLCWRPAGTTRRGMAGLGSLDAAVCLRLRCRRGKGYGHLGATYGALDENGSNVSDKVNGKLELDGKVQLKTFAGEAVPL